MKKHNISQRTPEWHQLRKGKITGTVLEKIMGTPYMQGETFYEVLAQRLTVGVKDEDDFENPMQRGERLEPEAVAAFEFETGLKTQELGFAEKDDNEFIANSPDRMIGDVGALEVKCPEGKNHIRYWLTNEVPKNYKWQIIQYFVVNEKLEYIYFTSYNPDIPRKSLVIIKATRDELQKDIEDAIKKQEEFINKINKTLEEIVEL